MLTFYFGLTNANIIIISKFNRNNNCSYFKCCNQFGTIQRKFYTKYSLTQIHNS